MSFTVRYRSLAIRDVEQLLAWREENLPTRVPAVEQDLSHAEKILSNSPLAFRHVYDSVRRIYLRRFPYKLWYVVDEERRMVRILACLHEYQDEDQFLGRAE